MYTFGSTVCLSVILSRFVKNGISLELKVIDSPNLHHWWFSW